MALGALVLSGTALLPTRLGKAPGGSRSGGFITSMANNNTTKRSQAPRGSGMMELPKKVVKEKNKRK